jgi:hypothetical protein
MSLIQAFLFAEINNAARVRFSPFARETLRILFMLPAVPSAHGCAHAPELSDIGDIAEAIQQLL